MRRVITYRELGLCVMLTFGTLATAQPIITGLSTPDSLDHFELGEAGAWVPLPCSIFSFFLGNSPSKYTVMRIGSDT